MIKYIHTKNGFHAVVKSVEGNAMPIISGWMFESLDNEIIHFAANYQIESSVFKWCDFLIGDPGYVGVKFVHCTFIDCNFCSTIFDTVTFVDCQFNGCKFHEATFHNTRIGECAFYNCSFSYAKFDGCSCGNVSFFQVGCRHTQFGDSAFDWVSFQGCEMPYADFSSAYLGYRFSINDCNIYGALGLREVSTSCPETGAFIAWKKLEDPFRTVIAKLEIPEDAVRVGQCQRKCRCSKALVLGFYGIESGEELEDKVFTTAGRNWTYKVGEMVYPDFFDPDPTNVCSNGIHFFMNRSDAEKYDFT